MAAPPIPKDSDATGRAAPQGAGKSVAKAVVLVLAAAGLAAAFAVPSVRGATLGAVGGFLDYVRGLGFAGPALLAAVYILATVLMAPGSLLTLGAGYAFGVVVGTLAVVVGSVGGAVAAMLVGRYFARDFVEGLSEKFPRFGAVDRAVEQDGFRIVLLTRLSPVLPFNVLNYLYGATRVSLRDYTLGSLVGMFPATVLYVYLGHAAGSLADLLQGKFEGGPAQKAALVVGLVATIAVTVLVTRLAGRALSQATPSATPPGGATP